MYVCTYKCMCVYHICIRKSRFRFGKRKGKGGGKENFVSRAKESDEGGYQRRGEKNKKYIEVARVCACLRDE